MRKYKFNHYTAILALALLTITGCKKVEKGYLSDNIFYLENPFTVQQGVTTTSQTLIGDGSTNPLHVQLSGITNLATGHSADSMFLRPDTILIYTDAVYYTDSTLALLHAKLKDSAVAPFSVNSIGGRLQFTQATQYVDTGAYQIGIKVSNIKGEKTIPKACDIIITPLSTMDSLFYRAWTTSDLAGNFHTQPASGMTITITRYAEGENKIVYKWVDKNGIPWNPAGGEIGSRTNRPTFRDWNPYYPEVRTDTSIDYQYPAGIPQVPAYNSTTISSGSSWSGGICYYQVKAAHTDISQNINTVSTILFYLTRGTYVVTYTMNTIARVP